MQSSKRKMTGPCSGGGFTLIELLVVIAIIALLISILLPSLGSARGVARQIVGLAMQKGLGEGQQMYGNNFKDFYAGLNTSGAYYQAIHAGGIIGANLMLGETNSSMPTSTFDWISPVIGDSANLSPNRARRTQQIFNRWRCPAATRKNDTLYGAASDRNDFVAATADGGFNQVSFLSPAAFHYYSQRAADANLVPRIGLNNAFRLRVDNHTTPVDVTEKFSPRFEKVGIQLSMKAMIMDGTRYLDGNELDFDIASNPSWFGSFTDGGPIYHGSTAYGRDSSSPSGGQGWKLSFRHPNRSMNVFFFDGHGASMKSEEAYREPKYWYPSGSIFTGGEATPESTAKYSAGSVID
jgi:prepilin-type N-terminal cleavage/methylation domain-containing protein/prepilin-type processing-associated H-X9-DG protein